MFDPYHSYLQSLIFYHLNLQQPFFNYQPIENQTKITSNFVLVQKAKNYPRIFQDKKTQETNSDFELTSRSQKFLKI
jgi:hypothetical protein